LFVSNEKPDPPALRPNHESLPALGMRPPSFAGNRRPGEVETSTVPTPVPRIVARRVRTPGSTTA
jgi:hypothetical protein